MTISINENVFGLEISVNDIKLV